MQIRDRVISGGQSTSNGHSNGISNGVANGTTHSKTMKPVASWGRAWSVDTKTVLGCLFLLTLCPLMPIFFNDACTNHECSLKKTLLNWTFKGPPFAHFANRVWSSLYPTMLLYLTWITGQVVLALLPDIVHHIFPSYVGGIRMGAVTPAGHSIKYRINGLQAWLITHFAWFLNAFYLHWFSPAMLFRLWGPLLVVVNILAYSLSFFVYIKGIFFPNHPDDCKQSGSAIYDFVMGIEFNPRVGLFDFKLFFNGRPGIVGWTIINLSYAWYQLETYGFVSDSMILLNILQAIYVLDFFWNEAWYLKTIDICHDHFGWMLAWGDLVWLPYMYTLQGFYLAHNPVILGPEKSISILVLGLLGYVIFRTCNAQKDRFRAKKDNCLIWGKRPNYIKCVFTSSDGKQHDSTLLYSGCWGIARHLNYTGDLMGSLAYCLCCGTDHLLPYFYFVFILMLLVHRVYRDEHRCSAKYGTYWDEYTRRVPYRLIPFIY
uniref:7-dehydrocholesterol reductase n=1 Tax=Phallusia mammillata TaxID=59560 RepID=A0A6F9DB18_9ASCI|nr:7-dehydrocholesterol reductase [Phallusia mammillata]